MKVKVYPEHGEDPVAEATLDGTSMQDQLSHLKHLVGGYLEEVRTPRLAMQKNVALVDEDARYKGRKPNYRGSSAIGYPTILMGTIVVIGEEPALTEDGGMKWTDIHE